MRHPFYEYLSRKGWTYNQLETLWAHNRRQNLWALIMISLGGVMFWYSHHDVKPELPQVIHFPNHYVAEETVEKRSLAGCSRRSALSMHSQRPFGRNGSMDKLGCDSD